MRHLISPWATFLGLGVILVIVVGGTALWGPPEVKQFFAAGGGELLKYIKSFWPF